MNLVDFAFYGSYSLAGPIDTPQSRTVRVLAGKLLALMLLSDCVLNLCRIGYMSFFGVRPGKYSVGGENVEASTLDGMKPERQNNRQGRLSNFLYQCMLIAFQAIVVGL